MSLELNIGSDVSGLISGVNAAGDRIAQLEQRIANLQRVAGQTTDFNKLNQAINLIKQNQLELTRIQTTAIPNFGKMATSTNELEKRIRIATSAEHEFNAILGSTPALLAGAENPAQALGREFLILATGVQRAREAGQSFGQISGTLLTSIFSLQGAITLGTALLFGFGKEIFGAGEKASKSAQQLEELLRPIEDIRKEAAAGTEGEIVKVQALADAVLDQTKSYKERNNALTQLKEINKSYFGDLTLESSKISELKSRVEEYSNALIQAAVVKAFQDQITEVEKLRSKSKETYTESIAKVNAYGQALEEARKKNSILNLSIPLTFAQERFAAAKKELDESAQSVFKLDAQFQQLKVAIDEAVGEQIKLKPLKEPEIPKPKKLKPEDFIPRDVNALLFVDTDLSPKVNVGKFKTDLENGIPELDNFHVALGVELATKKGNEKIVDDLKRQLEKATSFNKILDIEVQLGKDGGISKQAAEAAKVIDSTLTPAFQDLFSAIESGGNPLKAFFKGIEQSVQQLIAKLIAAVIEAEILNLITGGVVGSAKGFGAIFGKLLGFAEGGQVSGPGGPTSDAIPAFLSNGEYVVNAAAVSKYGSGFMNMINARKFAEGGLVTPFSAGSNADVLFPTSRIRSVIGGSADSNVKVTVVGDIDGNKIKLVQSRVERSQTRTG